MFAKKILFATMPTAGHFRPLTGLAVHLQKQGYDVRWYGIPRYAQLMENLSIPFYSFRQAQEVHQLNLDRLFPERPAIASALTRLRFDLKHMFLLRIPELIADLEAINHDFPFDLVICDVLFMASPFIRFLFGVPVIAAGSISLDETYPNLPLADMGLEPPDTFWERRKQAFRRFIATKVIYRPSTELFNSLLIEYGLRPKDALFFEALIRRVDLYWPNGQLVGTLPADQASTDQDDLSRYNTHLICQESIEKLLAPTFLFSELWP